MLYKYPCGCIGLEPEKGKHPLILMACDSNDDALPSNVSRIVVYRRHMQDAGERKPLSDEDFKYYLKAIEELKNLAEVGQQYINLAESSRRISEPNDEGTP